MEEKVGAAQDPVEVTHVDSTDIRDIEEHAALAAEHREHKPVAFTMSVLAVLVAITAVLGHRSHTEAVLSQNRATDQWNLYQARKIRSNNTELASDLLGVLALSDKAAADKLAHAYADHQSKWAGDLQQSMAAAQLLEANTEHAEAKAVRFDLGESLLEIGLVITSVTMLTNSRVYWYVGIIFSVAGVISALTVIFLP
jgi:hypothetical protein